MDRDIAVEIASAQRRPGREPRRHAFEERAQIDLPILAQRRPGREPRRHWSSATPSTPSRAAQRRPGREPRRHRSSRRSTRCSTPPLNEGRGVNPGDTPSLEPRSRPDADTLNEGRGVNPGDTSGRCRIRASRTALNEGRGVNPGDTPVDVESQPCRSSPAQRRPGREPRRHPPRREGSPSRVRPLNEGRGVNPGDTNEALDASELQRQRSTKAGA